MSCTERGYINPRLGFSDTGYSTASSYIYWFIGLADRRYYVLNVVCRLANIHEVRLAVMDDFGDLVVTS